MTFEIDVNGRVRRVAVERSGAEPGRFRVTVDGVPAIVDARRFGDYGMSLLFPEDGSASATVHISPGAARGERLAIVDGRAVPVTVNARRTLGSGTDAAASGDGEQRIAAPMPGRVVRLLVSAGDEVAARQGVAVVEAMKMENELRSPKAGRVKEVTVTAGMSVEAGRVLVIVE
jgi:biotin carboxyl carrier protein